MRRELLTITVIALAGVMMLGGCKKKVATPEAVAMSFTATTDGDGDEGGKTSLASNGAVLWTTGDKINVNGSELTLSSGADSYSGSFSGTPSGSYYVAAYPSSATITSSTVGSESVTFTLPATQTLTENSFGNGANPMVAKSNSNYLAFRNVCGGIAVRLYGASTGTMNKIVVTGKNGKKLNGTYTVYYSGDTPSATLTGNTNEITLESASPITLSASSASPTVFYVMLPAGDYSDGFNVKAYGNNGTIELLDKDFTSVSTVERNRLYLLASTQVSGVPAVTTSTATSIATTTATLNGNLTYAGVPTITEKGFVYSPTASTTSALIVDGSGCTKVTVDGTDTGDYTYNATGLGVGTKYYVRAYATNSVNTVYGDVVEFTTSSIPGALKGLFSIDDSGTQVYFSKSNLVYNSKYMFNDDQTYYVNTASLSANPRTFFNWSTTQGMASRTIYDSDGSTSCGTGWRILTKDEWSYLIGRTVNGNTGDGGAYRRVTLTDSKDGKAEVYGMIIFPDNYTGTVPSSGASITKTTFVNDYESVGCVFLPVAGYSDGSSVYNATTSGLYWSSTEHSDARLAFRLLFLSSEVGMGGFSKTIGISVRLVLATE